MRKSPRVIVYPGSFDPVTNGHMDLVHRASRLFDHVVIALAKNPHKAPLFTLRERKSFLEAAFSLLIQQGKVSVDTFDGLLVHYVLKRNAVAVLRGLRAVSDFEYEFQMALMNRQQAPRVETVFLMPDEKYTYLSSSLLKEICRLGGDIERFVPAPLAPQIRHKFKK